MQGVYKRRQSGEDYDSPLIITGCPRTGTSALAQCLSRHAAMCVLPEACLYDLDDDYLASRRSIVWDQLPFAVDGSLRAAIDALPPGTLTNSEMRRALFDALGQIKPLQVYGDKLPQRYLDQMESLCRRFPRARVIVTLRDGRDVVASQIRWYRERLRVSEQVEWWMRPSVASAERVWLNCMRRWERLRDRIATDRWLEVDYTRATAQPEAMLEDVCRFLRVPFDREMFRDGLEHYQAVHVGQWQLELPDIDNQVSNVFRGMLRRFGYESAAVARTA